MLKNKLAFALLAALIVLSNFFPTAVPIRLIWLAVFVYLVVNIVKKIRVYFKAEDVSE